MILAAGLSPAWQQILEFETLHVGRVNRAVQATWCASGKVLNVARALRQLEAPARTVCAVGGKSGEAIRAEFARHRIEAQWVEAGVPTRICTTILDCSCGETTELVENAAACEAAVFDEFARAYAAAASECAFAVITGSLPPNAPSGFVKRLLSDTRTPELLDIRGRELLDVLPLRPLVVKPNRHELAETVGRDLHDDSALLDAMREINRMGAKWVVISDGGRALWATSEKSTLRLQPPRVAVVNPIGCGDSLTAGLVDGLQRGLEFAEALRWGVAAAAANAERLLPADFEMDRVRELYAEVGVERRSARD